jgi:hypothetical protein
MLTISDYRATIRKRHSKNVKTVKSMINIITVITLLISLLSGTSDAAANLIIMREDADFLGYVDYDANGTPEIIIKTTDILIYSEDRELLFTIPSDGRAFSWWTVSTTYDGDTIGNAGGIEYTFKNGKPTFEDIPNYLPGYIADKTVAYTIGALDYPDTDFETGKAKEDYEALKEQIDYAEKVSEGNGYFVILNIEHGERQLIRIATYEPGITVNDVNYEDFGNAIIDFCISKYFDSDSERQEPTLVLITKPFFATSPHFDLYFITDHGPINPLPMSLWIYHGADGESIYVNAITAHNTPNGYYSHGLGSFYTQELYRFYRDGDTLIEYGGIDLPLEEFKKIAGSDSALARIAADEATIVNILYRSNNYVNINCTIEDEAETLCTYYTYRLNTYEFLDPKTRTMKTAYSLDEESLDAGYGMYLTSILADYDVDSVLYPSALPDFSVRPENITIRGHEIPLDCTEIMLINPDAPATPAIKNAIEITDGLNKDDISALKKLTGLKNLALFNVGVSDTEFLKTFTKLRYLNLDFNSIEDISFVSEMPYLKTLSLSHNPVSDITPLVKCYSLSGLDLSFTKVTSAELIPMSVNRLSLQSTGLDDLDRLKKLFFLNYLDISKNNVSDISVIKRFKYLEEFCAADNKITNIDVLANSDIDIIRMTGNNITDFSPLFTLWLNNPREIHMDFDDETAQKLREELQTCLVENY